jgi:hypothetical protein
MAKSLVHRSPFEDWYINCKNNFIVGPGCWLIRKLLNWIVTGDFYGCW